MARQYEVWLNLSSTLVILIKKGGLLQLGFGIVGAITRKVFHVSFPNVLCMLLITSSRIMAEKKIKRPIYYDFSHFTSII